MDKRRRSEIKRFLGNLSLGFHDMAFLGFPSTSLTVPPPFAGSFPDVLTLGVLQSSALDHTLFCLSHTLSYLELSLLF